MTKRQALEATRDHWRWIADAPDGRIRRKTEWPEMEARCEAIGCKCPPSCTCFLCEFAVTTGPGCSFCPLFGRWVPGRASSGCHDNDSPSPYEMWLEAVYFGRPDPAAARTYAAQIADLAQAALEEMR